ncbi:lactonase family protein [Variovorax sp. HJSM1_2]|uniref:lactonase family protein n=1 Tax=Variovorax sp. HJSM1_2 TaxID=3366263 RepID=UPI003BBF1C2F
MTGDDLKMLCWKRLLGLVLLATFGAQTAVAAECAATELAYVGTDGQHLRALHFDACSGQMAMIGTVAELPKPRWAVLLAQPPVLYVASDGDGKVGSVVSFALDRHSGALTRINEAAAGGAGTTHLWLDQASKTLLAANFGSGSAASLPLRPDGSVGAVVSTLKATGSGPHRRQASPHAHGISVDPTGRYALVADMGADRVFVYEFDRATHALATGDTQAEAASRSFATPAGSGPRRAIFGASSGASSDADGRFVYVLNELTAEVMVLRWDGRLGRLSLVQTAPLSGPAFDGAKSASEIAVSRDGRFVYALNRAENTIVVLRVDPASGELSTVQRLPSGGEAPWAFDIHTSGQWLLVANYRSNRLNLFRIDAASGLLADSGQALESPAPVSITFAN